MGQILVIGYGNTLRGDDGIGPAVASALAGLQPPDVCVRVVQQLTPELAEEMTHFTRVIFVDAAVDGEGITITPLAPADSGGSFTHFSNPRGLLALTQSLYDRRPAAWLVSVAGEDFDYRLGLTPRAQARVSQAIARIVDLIRRPQA